MVFQIMLVIILIHDIYVGGYQATHFVGLFAAPAAQAYQLCIESNSTIYVVTVSSYTGDRHVIQCLCGAIQRN